MKNKDKSWVLPTIVLCSSGFFHSLNPSEAYLTPYLMGPRKNFTGSECVNQIFPVWSYSYLSCLVPVFLLTDFLKYKPVIIVEGFCYVGCWILLIFGQSVFEMQIMQVFYGMGTAAQIGYYSYIYSIVSEERYQQVTSYTRTAVLIGCFLGAAVAQLLVSLANIDYYYLNIIALTNICIGLCISFFLPMPKKTLFFYTEQKPSINVEQGLIESTNAEPEKGSADDEDDDELGQKIKTSSWKNVVSELLRGSKIAYSDSSLLRWSVWWALSTCGYMLVVNSIQNLWETIYSSAEYTSQVYNGAVEALATVLGAVGAFGVGFINVSWKKWGELALGCCSVCKCVLLVVLYFTKNIWTSYAGYVAYIFLYNLVITIAQFQLAVGLNTERIALVFGINTFMALALNMALTLIIIDDAGFGMDVKTLFIVFSVYFGIVAVLYLGHAFYSAIRQTLRKANDADHETVANT